MSHNELFFDLPFQVSQKNIYLDFNVTQAHFKFKVLFNKETLFNKEIDLTEL